MFAGCLQIMRAHSHLIRVGGAGYSQIIRAESADVCRSYELCLQSATHSRKDSRHQKWRPPHKELHPFEVHLRSNVIEQAHHLMVFIENQ
jgi:hypothetical protein